MVLAGGMPDRYYSSRRYGRMKIKIKECVGNSRIYGEDGKLAGTIEGWPKNGPVREICGTDGGCSLPCQKRKRRCVIENRTEPRLNRKFQSHSNMRNGQTSAETAKEAERRFCFGASGCKGGGSTDGRSCYRTQNRKREIVLEDCEGRIGRITWIASLTGHEVECERNLMHTRRRCCLRQLNICITMMILRWYSAGVGSRAGTGCEQ